MTKLNNMSIRIGEDLHTGAVANAKHIGMNLRLYASVLMRRFISSKRTNIPVRELIRLRLDQPQVKIIVGIDEQTQAGLSAFCSENDLRFIDVWRFVLSQKLTRDDVKELRAVLKDNTREEKVMRTYKLPVSLSNAIDAYAEKNAISRTDILVEALDDFFAR